MGVSDRLRRLGLLLPLVAWAAAVPAHAQTVSGRLVESGSSRPVVLGRVALLDTALVVVEITYTDHEGNFSLQAPTPGDYLIAADRPGYERVIDGIIELGEGGFLPIHLYIKPRPIELPGLTATVLRARVQEKLVRAGFYDRLAAGFGHFVSPEEIRERQPPDFADLLRRVPGPLFQDDGLGGSYPLFRARGRTPMTIDENGVPQATAPGGYCLPRIYVDGMLVWSPDFPPPPPAMEELVAIEDVAAAEVYAGGASLPLQWGGSQGSCGVIVLWTGG